MVKLDLGRMFSRYDPAGFKQNVLGVSAYRAQMECFRVMGQVGFGQNVD